MAEPKMTRVHFRLIASTLKGAKPAEGAFEGARLHAWSSVVRDFASTLRTTNSNFNRGRFLEACGLEE